MPRVSLPAVDDVPGGRAVAGLSRRVRTLIVAGVLFLVLFVLALVLPVPYVILSPGPTYDTLGTEDRADIIQVDGRAPNPTSGKLRMTTIATSGETISAFQALSGWLSGDEVVVPRADIYPPGQSQDQVNKQNAQDFQQSQDSATAAALCELGYPEGFGIIDVTTDGPSHGKLQPGDQFVSIDGTPVTSRTALDKELRSLAPGTKATVVVKRGSGDVTVQVTLGAPPKGQPSRPGGFLGVVPDNTCLAPFTVTLSLAGVGGPSAGMMFALGIIEKVGSYAQLVRKVPSAAQQQGRFDLTNGRVVAGTGTIDKDGNVGAIGGIALKMIAAKRDGATLFLAPQSNCGDVRDAIPSGLKVVPVSTLSQALSTLFAVKDGKTAGLPHC